MFAHICRRSYVCLNCQSLSKAHVYAALWDQRPVLQNATLRRRWQSAQAAHRVDEDDEFEADGLSGHQEYDEDVKDGHTIRWLDQSGEEAPGPNEPILQGDYLKPRRSYKSWTPVPTARLQTHMLGQAAEILVLPELERHGGSSYREDDYKEDRKVDMTVSKSHLMPRKTIQESLAEESKPVTIEQVFANIEQTRSEHRQDEDPAKNRELLRRGFTRAQLQKYAEHTKLLSLEHGTISKKRLLDLITADKPGSEKDVIEYGSRQDVKLDAQKLINLPRSVAELFLKTGRVQQLQEAHSSHKLHLEMHSKGLFASAKREESINEVIQTLSEWRRKVVSQVIGVPAMHLINGTVDPSPEMSGSPGLTRQASTLLAQFPVTIDARAGKVFAFSRSAINEFERALVLLAHKTVAQSETSSAPVYATEFEHDVSPIELVTTTYQAQSITDPVLIRSFASNSILNDSSKDKDKSSALKKLLSHAVEASTKAPSPATSLSYIRNEHIRPSVSMEIGHLLQADNQHEFDSDAALVPFLQHFLLSPNVTQVEQSSGQPIGSAVEEPGKEERHQSFQLSFRSADDFITNVEWQVSGNFTSKTSVDLNEIVLRFASGSTTISFRETPVDFQICTQSTVLLFRRGTVIEPVYARLLSELGGKLLRQTTSSIPESGTFNTILSLEVPRLTLFEDKVHEKTKAAKTVRMKLVLDRAEQIDRRWYKLPELAENPCVLEYTLRTPLNEDSIGEPKETLRIVFDGEAARQEVIEKAKTKIKKSNLKPKKVGAQPTTQEIMGNVLGEATLSISRSLQDFARSEIDKMVNKYPRLI